MKHPLSIATIFFLLFLNLLYASVGVCTKYASAHAFGSWPYLMGFGGALAVMFVYALLWQQVLRRIDLSIAYLFKCTALIFTMLLSYFLYSEPITLQNILGAAIILLGIVLYNLPDSTARPQKDTP